MTIGKNSRKSSVRSSIRAPKFLDKSSGFYGRLDEPETATEAEEVRSVEVVDWREDGHKEREVGSNPVIHNSEGDQREEAEVFHFTEGMMEDDGETLLRKKPSRLSSRWRRSSRRKQKEGRVEEDTAREERPSLSSDDLEDTRVKTEIETEKLRKLEEENEKDREKEPVLAHFPAREDADDQVLIREKKRGREEEGEEGRKMKREQEEGMKVVKRKNYRKALDQALRRGWEAFIANLYSVTLTPVTSPSSPSSPSSKRKQLHSSLLAQFQ
ncbi:uncharacterized protein KZ484_024966 [Pholidichthys leucotaenia]